MEFIPKDKVYRLSISEQGLNKWKWQLSYGEKTKDGMSALEVGTTETLYEAMEAAHRTYTTHEVGFIVDKDHFHK
jgi:hypothetical protein